MKTTTGLTRKETAMCYIEAIGTAAIILVGTFAIMGLFLSGIVIK